MGGLVFVSVHSSTLLSHVQQVPIFFELLKEKKNAKYKYLLSKEAIKEVGSSNVVHIVTTATPISQRVG